MYPILIIQTPYTTVVYIQNQKYIEQSELLPLSWMKIGEIGARMGIQDYSVHVKKIYICENEVNVGVDLRSFPDRYEYLSSEIVNIVLGGVNVVRNDTVDDKMEVVVKNEKNNKNKRKLRRRIGKYCFRYSINK